ncbi:MAG: hypothetical protein LBU13_09930, partial [Synergistaceae bacterium]|nr:hypothetical protein [Synergistaceae bacterium]
MDSAPDGRDVLIVRWRGRFSAVAVAILGTVAWAAVLCLVLRKYGEDNATELPFLLPALVIVCVLGIAGGLFLAACHI